MALQEVQALIKYIQQNKATDSDWFTITSNKEGTKWNGKCWYIHSLLKYEFPFEFEIPATYPATAPEIKIPELDGKTAKMYRGGSICLTVHFKPLWAKNRSVTCLCFTRLVPQCFVEAEAVCSSLCRSGVVVTGMLNLCGCLQSTLRNSTCAVPRACPLACRRNTVHGGEQCHHIKDLAGALPLSLGQWHIWTQVVVAAGWVQG